MSKKLISVASRLVTMEQVDAIEQAMIKFGVTDPCSRPLRYAQHTPDNPCEPLAAVFLYLHVDDADPKNFRYEFDAGYRTADVDRELVQPDTFLTIVRFATMLKRGE